MIAAAVAALALAAPAPAAPPERPSVSVRPAAALPGGFRWEVSDYALRCDESGVRLRVRGAGGWQARVQDTPPRRGSFSRRVTDRPGARTTVTFTNGERRRSFHLRCLPPDFPAYRFRRLRPGGPAYVFMQMKRGYAAIFDSNGTPVWWYRADGTPHNFRLLRPGVFTLATGYGDMRFGPYELRTLRGRLVGTVAPPDGEIDVHEILPLADGHHMVARRVQRLENTSPDGPVLANVVDIEIEELDRQGAVVWRWSSADHIAPSETGRWWQTANLAGQPYDLYHWNATAVKGGVVLLTFRHLDAVYAISRASGEILWKLGGTETAESLRVVGDPHGDYPLGGPHDARFLPDGTISVYDNHIDLPGDPRVVRYRVNAAAGTARLVEAFSDRAIHRSFCCGSARLVGKSWIVGWGGQGLVGAYDGNGERIFTLRTTSYGYRANYATENQLKIGAVRSGMDALAHRGAAG